MSEILDITHDIYNFLINVNYFFSSTTIIFPVSPSLRIA